MANSTQLQVQQLNTIREVKTTLLNLSQSPDLYLANLLKAQLQVLEALDGRNCENAIDLLIKHLKLAKDYATGNQVHDLRTNGTIMVNSIICLLHMYKSEKTLTQSCNLAAQSTNNLIASAGGFITIVTNGTDLLQDLMQSKKDINFDFNRLENIIDKLHRNRELFEKSSILKELVLKNKNNLATMNAGWIPDKDDYFKLVKTFIWLSVAAVSCMIVVWFISLIPRGGEALVNATGLTEVGGATLWYNNTGTWIKNTILGSAIITLTVGAIQYIRYQIQVISRNNRISSMDKAYTSMANDFYRE